MAPDILPDGGGVPDEVLDELLRVPPAKFVATRDRLAKQLRAERHREAATAVKAMRRPTPALWALDQLGPRRPEDVERLLEVGRRLRAAQEGALGGRGAARLRDAMADRRAVVHDLARLADGWIREEGVSPAGHRDELAAALEAVTSDPDASERLRTGRLVRLPEPGAGLDLLLSASVPAGRSPPRPASADRATADRAAAEEAEAAADAARDRRDAAAARVAELEHELRAAQRELASAERELASREADSRRARERADRAERRAGGEAGG